MALSACAWALIATVAVSTVVGVQARVCVFADQPPDTNCCLLKPCKPAFNWTVDFAEKHGYPMKKYQVRTEDGFHLTLHRITGTKKVKNKGGPPVLLHHGFLGSAADWLVQGPRKSLGLILADEGFDVWLANARGSANSLKHDTLPAFNSQFWNWTFHQVGTQDIVAEIDFILTKTKKESLSFVAFSLGTTSFFALGATNPQYLKKVNKMVALAPIAHMRSVKSPALTWIAPLTTREESMKNLFKDIGGFGEFWPSERFLTWSTDQFCKNDTVSRKLCYKNALITFFGLTTDKVDSTVIDRIFETSPAAGSRASFVHLGQLMQAAPTFGQYNHGKAKNLLIYKQATPPVYNTRLLDVPMYIFLSEGDLVANKADVHRLVSKLPRAKLVKFASRLNFSHYDFLYASDAADLVYRDVVEILHKRN